jgi:hypothetical protein
VSADEDDFVESVADDAEPPCMTELEEKWIDRLLAIRQHSVGVVEATQKMLAVLDDIDVEILCAKATGNAAAVAEYMALRKFVKESI